MNKLGLFLIVALWPWPVAFLGAEYWHFCGLSMGFYDGYAPAYVFRDVARIAVAAWWGVIALALLIVAYRGKSCGASS